MRHVFGLFLVTLALSACGDGSATSGGTEYVPPGRALAGDPCSDNGAFAGACVRLEDTCPGGGVRPAILRCDQHRWTCVQNDTLGGCSIPSACDPSTGSVGTACIVTGLTCSNGAPAMGTTVCMGSAWICASNADTCHADGGLTDASADASVATQLIVAYQSPVSTQLIAGQMEGPIFNLDMIALRDMRFQLPDFAFEVISGQLRNDFGRPSFVNASLIDVEARNIVGVPIEITNGPDGRLMPIHFPSVQMSEGQHKTFSIHVNVQATLDDREVGTQFRVIAGAGNGRFFADGAVLVNDAPIPPEAIRGNVRMESVLLTLARPRVRVVLGDRVHSHTVVRNTSDTATIDIEAHNDTEARVIFHGAHLYGVVDLGRGYTGTDVGRSATNCWFTDFGGTIVGRSAIPTSDGSIFSAPEIPIEPRAVAHIIMNCGVGSTVRNEVLGDRLAFGVRDHSDFEFLGTDGFPVRTYVEPELFRQLTTPSVVVTIAQHGTLEVMYTPGTSYPVTGDGSTSRYVITTQLRTTAETGGLQRIGVRILGASECVEAVAIMRDGGILGDWVPVPTGSHGVTASTSTPVPINTETWARAQVAARFRRTGTGPGACHSGSVVTFAVAQGATGDFSGWSDPYAADLYVIGNTSGLIIRTHEPVTTGDTVTIL